MSGYFDVDTIPFYYEMFSLVIWAIVQYPIVYIALILLITLAELSLKYLSQKYSWSDFYPRLKGLKWIRNDTKRKVDTKIHDINRILLRLSITVIHFIFFKMVEQGDFESRYTRMRNTIIMLVSYNVYALKVDTKEYYKISSLIFIISLLLIPIIHTLTKEICYDTIYLYHFLAQFIFIVNSVYYQIHQEPKPARVYSEQEILKLEESINIPRKNQTSMNYGYSSMMIGVILLSSRFINISSVFCFLSVSLIFFVCFPRIQELMGIHKSLNRTVIYLICISYLLHKVNTVLSWVFMGFSASTYMFYCFFDFVNDKNEKHKSLKINKPV